MLNIDLCQKVFSLVFFNTTLTCTTRFKGVAIEKLKLICSLQPIYLLRSAPPCSTRLKWSYTCYKSLCFSSTYSNRRQNKKNEACKMASRLVDESEVVVARSCWVLELNETEGSSVKLIELLEEKKS